MKNLICWNKFMYHVKNELPSDWKCPLFQRWCFLHLILWDYYFFVTPISASLDIISILTNCYKQQFILGLKVLKHGITSEHEVKVQLFLLMNTFFFPSCFSYEYGNTLMISYHYFVFFPFLGDIITCAFFIFYFWLETANIWSSRKNFKVGA